MLLQKLQHTQASTWLAVMRIALGLVLIIGGWKLAFPEDPAGLAASYIDPEAGWIAPYFAEWIQTTLGLEIISFLNIMGGLEMIVGLALVLGLMTPVFGTIAAVMFWSFAVANPVVGVIRLSRDLALMGIAIAVAAGGSGTWALDGKLQLPMSPRAWIPERTSIVLVLIRYSIAFTLILSAVFHDGVMANVLNTTIPWLIVGLMGLLLLVGVYPRVVLGLFATWMTILLVVHVVQDPFYPGLDSVKRELGMGAAALFYTFIGPDRWSRMHLGSVEEPSEEIEESA